MNPLWRYLGHALVFERTLPVRTWPTGHMLLEHGGGLLIGACDPGVCGSKNGNHGHLEGIG